MTQRDAMKRWISGSQWFWLLEQYKGRFANDTLDMMEAFVAALHRGDLNEPPAAGSQERSVTK